LWRACVADLARKPFAPWTAMAARARRDGRARQLVERALVAAIQKGPPHDGGANVTVVPELALTALAVEALAGAPGAAAAVRRARAFLRRWQLVPEALRAALDPSAAYAFPASPVVDLLRVDMTGHALLALAPSGRT
jgi:hypothetical protein